MHSERRPAPLAVPRSLRLERRVLRQTQALGDLAGALLGERQGAHPRHAVESLALPRRVLLAPSLHDGLDLVQQARHLRPGRDAAEEAERGAPAIAQVGLEVSPQVASSIERGLTTR